jgi:hypothetical protein
MIEAIAPPRRLGARVLRAFGVLAIGALWIVSVLASWYVGLGQGASFQAAQDVTLGKPASYVTVNGERIDLTNEQQAALADRQQQEVARQLASLQGLSSYQQADDAGKKGWADTAASQALSKAESDFLREEGIDTKGGEPSDCHYRLVLPQPEDYAALNADLAAGYRVVDKTEIADGRALSLLLCR